MEKNLKKGLDKKRQKPDTQAMSKKAQVRTVIGMAFVTAAFVAVILMTGDATMPPLPLVLPPTPMPMLPYTPPLHIVKIVYPTPPGWVSPRLVQYIIDEANNLKYKTKIPVPLIFKLIEWESGWDQRSYNNNYVFVKVNGKLIKKLASVDRGLMMLNSLYAADFIHDYRDPWRKASSYDVVNNPFDNVQIGIRRLRAMYDIFGTWTEAIEAYNAGITTVALGWKLADPTVREVNYVIPIEGWWTSPPGVEIVYNKH